MELTAVSTSGLPRSEVYGIASNQLEGLLAGENDVIANLANASALISELFGWHWVGFYLVKDNELILGPFQGPVACTRIAYGKGVCGTAWESQSMINVPDVEQFPGHIACSALSKSEIVIPLMVNGECVAVLDIDSDRAADFSEIDENGLAALCVLICEALARSAHG